MALVNPYCSPWDVQQELHNADADNAAWWEHCINAASRLIDEWRGRDYYLHDHATVALVMRGTLSEWVQGTHCWLPYWPVLTLTEVKEHSTVLVAETDYVVIGGTNDLDRAALVRVGGDWAQGVALSESISIKGTFGYAQTSSAAVPTGIPDHIRKAATLLASAFSTYEQKEILSADGMRDRIATKSIPPQVATLLGPRARRALA